VQKQKERNWQPSLSERKLGFSPTYVIILGAKTKRAKLATFVFGTQIRHSPPPPNKLLLFWVQKPKRAKLATFVFGTQIGGRGGRGV
jgi:hypothetical protein